MTKRMSDGAALGVLFLAGCATAQGTARNVALDDGVFQLDGDVIRRAGNEPGQSRRRHYMRTVRSDYVSSDWTCQITFRTPDNAPDDIIFIGLGEGVPDGSFYNEPRNSLNFRIHQGQTAFGVNWRVDVVAHDTGAFHFTHSTEAGHLPGPKGGMFTARIHKTGGQAIFQILDTPITVTIPDIRAVAPFLYVSGSRIFFGNASSAYSFEGPRVIPDRGQPWQ